MMDVTHSLLPSSCTKRRWQTLHHRSLSSHSWDTRVVGALSCMQAYVNDDIIMYLLREKIHCEIYVITGLAEICRDIFRVNLS